MPRADQLQQGVERLQLRMSAANLIDVVDDFNNAARLLRLGGALLQHELACDRSWRIADHRAITSHFTS
jgi:hypothetical protein